MIKYIKTSRFFQGTGIYVTVYSNYTIYKFIKYNISIDDVLTEPLNVIRLNVPRLLYDGGTFCTPVKTLVVDYNEFKKHRVEITGHIFTDGLSEIFDIFNGKIYVQRKPEMIMGHIDGPHVLRVSYSTYVI